MRIANVFRFAENKRLLIFLQFSRLNFSDLPSRRVGRNVSLTITSDRRSCTAQRKQVRRENSARGKGGAQEEWSSHFRQCLPTCQKSYGDMVKDSLVVIRSFVYVFREKRPLEREFIGANRRRHITLCYRRNTRGRAKVEWIEERFLDLNHPYDCYEAQEVISCGKDVKTVFFAQWEVACRDISDRVDLFCLVYISGEFLHFIGNQTDATNDFGESSEVRVDLLRQSKKRLNRKQRSVFHRWMQFNLGNLDVRALKNFQRTDV